MIEDLNKAKAGSVILFHSCAHNPTGVDPSNEQWDELAELCLKKKIITIF